MGAKTKMMASRHAHAMSVRMLTVTCRGGLMGVAAMKPHSEHVAAGCADG